MTYPAPSVTSLRSSKRIQNIKSATAVLISRFDAQDPLLRLISRTDTNKTINRISTDQLRRYLMKWNAGKPSPKEHPKEAILDRCYKVRDDLEAAFHKDFIIGQSNTQVAVVETPAQDDTDTENSDDDSEFCDEDTDDEIKIVYESRKRPPSKLQPSMYTLASPTKKFRQSTIPTTPKVPQSYPAFSCTQSSH